jgi:O-antigen/teichoic acid export membrane protein
LERVFRLGTKWGFYISLPIFAMILFAPREILYTLFGDAYEVGWSALLILSVGQLANVSTGAVGSLLVLTGYQNYWLLISLTAFVSNVLFSWFLVPRIGINGAAISTSLSITFLYALAIILTARFHQISPYDKSYFKGLGAILLALIVVPFIRLISLPHFWFVGVTGLIVVVVYFSLLWIFQLNEDDQEFLNILKKRVIR